MSRDLVFVTTGRQDFGILRSTLIALRGHPFLRARVWAGGMHMSAAFGRTVAILESEGFAPDRVFDFLEQPPRPAADAARFIEQLDKAFAQARPDAVVLVGDRSETLAAAFAATVNRVPIIHLHGGEETEGAIDNALRHALTKLAQLHLVSHPIHAQRVLQLGEPSDRVHLVGPPGVDNVLRDDLATRAELAEYLGIPLVDPVVVVTVHPATLGDDDDAAAVIAAMQRVPATYVVTMPNADSGGTAIREKWLELAAGQPRVVAVDALGERRYWGLLRVARAVLGNSSSGIIEAPAAGLHAVNVGDRQKGRLRTGPVTDVPADPRLIQEALTAALSGSVVAASGHSYPPPPAAPRIVRALETFDFDADTRKVFRDATGGFASGGHAITGAVSPDMEAL